MLRTDRTIAPRKGRIAEAARSGLFPYSSALVTAAGLLSAAALLALWGEKIAISLKALLENGLRQAVVPGVEPEALLMNSLLEGAKLLLPILLVVFTATAIVALAPAIWSQRRPGRTAVPLPAMPAPRVAPTAIRILGAAVFLLISFKILRDHPIGWSSITSENPFLWHAVVKRFQNILLAGGIILLFVGLAEMSLMRYEILRALRLSSLESRREERAAEGDAAIKGETKRRGRRRVAP